MKALIIEDKEYIRKGLINLLEMIEADVNIFGECESVKEAVAVANA
jgi:two-component system LytT family response regulator